MNGKKKENLIYKLRLSSGFRSIHCHKNELINYRKIIHKISGKKNQIETRRLSLFGFAAGLPRPLSRRNIIDSGSGEKGVILLFKSSSQARVAFLEF